MPFYLRKSIGAGPLRFNLSKGGIGLSLGIKGLRIGTGPRGHYVHAGREGIYYRTSLGGRRKVRPAKEPEGPAPGSMHQNGDVAMIEIDTSSLQDMRDGSSGAIIDDITQKRRRISMSKVLAWLFGFLGWAYAPLFGFPSLAGTALALVGWALGRWIDSYRKSAILFYELDAETEKLYADVVQAFDSLCQSNGKWHVEAGTAVHDLNIAKRNGGAAHLLKRVPAIFSYRLPIGLRSNVTPPCMKAGTQTLYVLPDLLLVDDGSSVGAVEYRSLKARCEQTRYVEDGQIPQDAEIVDYAWQYQNKDGSQDGRFKDNHRLPVCQYEAMHLSSSSGLNELFQFSKVGVAEAFSLALSRLSQTSPPTSKPSYIPSSSEVV